VLGRRVTSIATDFDPRTYGYRKLSDLVRQTGAFEIRQQEGGGMRVRFNPQTAPSPTKKGRRRQAHPLAKAAG
jgi:hypothetical protein